MDYSSDFPSKAERRVQLNELSPWHVVYPKYSINKSLRLHCKFFFYYDQNLLCIHRVPLHKLLSSVDLSISNAKMLLIYFSFLCNSKNIFSFAGHTGRLLKSLCFTSMTFLLLHIIYQITINSLLAGENIEPNFNCEYQPLLFIHTRRKENLQSDLINISVVSSRQQWDIYIIHLQ